MNIFALRAQRAVTLKISASHQRAPYRFALFSFGDSPYPPIRAVPTKSCVMINQIFAVKRIGFTWHFALCARFWKMEQDLIFHLSFSFRFWNIARQENGTNLLSNGFVRCQRHHNRGSVWGKRANGCTHCQRGKKRHSGHCATDLVQPWSIGFCYASCRSTTVHNSEQTC